MVMKMPAVTFPECGIQDVWSSNLEEEFSRIRKIVQKYGYIAMVGSLLQNMRRGANYKIRRPVIQTRAKKIYLSNDFSTCPLEK